MKEGVGEEGKTFLFFLSSTPPPRSFTRPILRAVSYANYKLLSYFFFVLLGFKYLTEVFRDNLQIQESVGKLLQKKVPDAGGWKQLAHKYEMAEETRDSLEGHQERGKSVIEYLKSAHPELTVYEFCKCLKDIKRNDIIILLSDHLVSVAN